MVSRVSDIVQVVYTNDIPTINESGDESTGGSRLVAGMIVSFITIG